MYTILIDGLEFEIPKVAAIEIWRKAKRNLSREWYLETKPGARLYNGVTTVARYFNHPSGGLWVECYKFHEE